MSKTTRTLLSVASALAVIPALACGRSTASSALSSEYCDAVKTVFQYDAGLRGETDANAVKAAYARTMRDLEAPLATVEANGPPAAKRAARGLRTVYTASRDEGTDPFDGEVGRLSTLVRVSRESCAWPALQIGASDFAFDVPSTLTRGTVALQVRNRSVEEPHLFLLARVRNGVDKPLDELVSQFGGPDTEGTDIEFVDGGAFAFPGRTAYGVVDLAPGRYVYMCPLPVNGATSEEDNHMRRGMRGEFAVA